MNMLRTPALSQGERGEENILEVEEAVAAGLVSLTNAFGIYELRSARGVYADLERGGIPAALVRVPGGLEVWRGRQGMVFAECGMRNEECEMEGEV